MQWLRDLPNAFDVWEAGLDRMLNTWYGHLITLIIGILALILAYYDLTNSILWRFGG